MNKRILSFGLSFLLAGALVALPGAARAEGPEELDLDHIQLTYHGGALMRHVRVVTLFWGESWSNSTLPGYFNQFFRELFADGRYLANLAQYGTQERPIENGRFEATATDPVSPGKTVADHQIQAEIRAQIAAGKLPQPDENTLYVIFTPPHVLVDDDAGGNSDADFLGYHDYAGEGQFAYAVIPYNDRKVWGDPRLMTLVVSHELAEAVTDPQPGDQAIGGGGWYDPKNGEVGDIPAFLYYDRRIDAKQFGQLLTGADGARYLVQTNWSNRDHAPVAFAETTNQ